MCIQRKLAIDQVPSSAGNGGVYRQIGNVGRTTPFNVDFLGLPIGLCGYCHSCFWECFADIQMGKRMLANDTQHSND